jgi:hypothetical protein
MYLSANLNIYALVVWRDNKMKNQMKLLILLCVTLGLSACQTLDYAKGRASSISLEQSRKAGSSAGGR